MRTVFHCPASACAPTDTDVLAAPGMSGPDAASPVTTVLIRQAREIFLAQAEPAGIWANISVAEFGLVFPGEDRNAPGAPLQTIYPKAAKLALFACTIGPRVCEHIRMLFEQHDYALGYVLDAVASAATERLADLVQEEYTRQFRCQESESLQSEVCNLKSAIVLRYSPGYCGWHVSGQRRLFAFLRPGDIGITLRESFLMEPLKSVSGVFVLGPARIHRFEPGFDFCSECRNPSCRDRLAAIQEE